VPPAMHRSNSRAPSLLPKVPRRTTQESASRKGIAHFSKKSLPALTAIASILALAIPFSAQDRPVLRVQDDCTSFGYAYNGWIAYSTREIFHVKKQTFERDDIWTLAPNGGKRRLIDGEKFTRGDTPISYAVRAFRWSPDSMQLTVELFTGRMKNAHGDNVQGIQTLLLDNTGREIKVAGGDSLVAGAADAQWLPDNDSLVYLTQSNSASGPFSITELHAISGQSAKLYAGHGFAAVAWLPQQHGGVAVETNASRSGAIKLVWLDLASQQIRDLATLDSYVSGLTISPSARRVAYFVDPEVLEIRDLEAPERVARAHVAVGTYFWAPDDSRVLLKRGPENESRDLVWVQLPPLTTPRPGADIPIAEPTPQPIFYDLEYPAFAISPDGRQLAVIDEGKGNLDIYPLP